MATPFNPLAKDAPSPSPFHPFANDAPPPAIADVHLTHTTNIIVTYALFMAAVAACAVWKRGLIRMSHPYPIPEPPAAPEGSRRSCRARPYPPSQLPPLKALLRIILILLYILVGPFLIGYLCSMCVIAMDDDIFNNHFFPKVAKESEHQRNPQPVCDYFNSQVQIFMSLYGGGVMNGLNYFVKMSRVFPHRWHLVFTPLMLLVGVSIGASKGIMGLCLGWSMVGVASGMASQAEPLLIKKFVPEAARAWFLAGNDISRSLGMICAYGICIYGVISWKTVFIIFYCLVLFYMVVSFLLCWLCSDYTIVYITFKGLGRDTHLIFLSSFIQIFQDVMSLDFLMLYIALYFEAKKFHMSEAYVGSIIIIAATTAGMIGTSLLRMKRYDAAEMMVVVLGQLMLWGFLHYRFDRLPSLVSSITLDIFFVVTGSLILVGFLKRDFFHNATPEDVEVPFSIFKKGLSSLVSIVILFLFPRLECRFKFDFFYGFALSMVLLFFFILNFMK